MLVDISNVENFHLDLNECMEAARAEPVRITRKSGEAFVLMNAEEFERPQAEVATLRGVASGLADTAHGRVS